MKDFLIKLSVKWQILKSESGQDLVEYALVAALIAMGVTGTMSTVAADIGTIFSSIGTKISTVVT